MSQTEIWQAFQAIYRISQLRSKNASCRKWCLMIEDWPSVTMRYNSFSKSIFSDDNDLDGRDASLKYIDSRIVITRESTSSEMELWRLQVCHRPLQIQKMSRGGLPSQYGTGFEETKVFRCFKNVAWAVKFAAVLINLKICTFFAKFGNIVFRSGRRSNVFRFTDVQTFVGSR